MCLLVCEQPDDEDCLLGVVVGPHVLVCLESAMRHVIFSLFAVVAGWIGWFGRSLTARAVCCVWLRRGMPCLVWTQPYSTDCFLCLVWSQPGMIGVDAALQHGLCSVFGMVAARTEWYGRSLTARTVFCVWYGGSTD